MRLFVSNLDNRDLHVYANTLQHDGETFLPACESPSTERLVPIILRWASFLQRRAEISMWSAIRSMNVGLQIDRWQRNQFATYRIQVAQDRSTNSNDRFLFHRSKIFLFVLFTFSPIPPTFSNANNNNRRHRHLLLIGYAVRLHLASSDWSPAGLVGGA